MKILHSLLSNYILKIKSDGLEPSFLLSHIRKMEDWASQTYENHGISFCLGVDPNITEEGEINLTNLYDEPFCKVLTTGIESMVICNAQGNVINYQTHFQVIHENKKTPQSPIDTNASFIPNSPNCKSKYGFKKINNPKHKTEILTPHIFKWLAQWTSQSERIVIHLNSRGEILLFHNGTLAFAKRNSKWHATTLIPLIHRLAETSHYNKEMKKALSQTCIDVAFRRTGACIGILRLQEEKETTELSLLDKRDILALISSDKTKFFNKLINNKKFQDLPQELRQELVAVDGATILDREGNIIAVGAILNLNSDSFAQDDEKRQGGRNTAAKQLAYYGVGIKVSADGGITAWQRSKDSNAIHKFFEIF